MNDEITLRFRPRANLGDVVRITGPAHVVRRNASGSVVAGMMLDAGAKGIVIDMGYGMRSTLVDFGQGFTGYVSRDACDIIDDDV